MQECCKFLHTWTLLLCTQIINTVFWYSVPTCCVLGRLINDFSTVGYGCILTEHLHGSGVGINKYYISGWQILITL